jgi:hypothetical protein
VGSLRRARLLQPDPTRLALLADLPFQGRYDGAC